MRLLMIFLWILQSANIYLQPLFYQSFCCSLTSSAKNVLTNILVTSWDSMSLNVGSTNSSLSAARGGKKVIKGFFQSIISKQQITTKIYMKVLYTYKWISSPILVAHHFNKPAFLLTELTVPCMNLSEVLPLAEKPSQNRSYQCLHSLLSMQASIERIYLRLHKNV